MGAWGGITETGSACPSSSASGGLVRWLDIAPRRPEVGLVVDIEEPS